MVAKLTEYCNADEFWMKRYKPHSGDEVLALDVGYVKGWNACVDAMSKERPLTTQELVSMIVDRHYPDEAKSIVVDWDLRGKPITVADVERNQLKEK